MRKVAVVVLVLAACGFSVWALQAMGVVDFTGVVLNRLQRVPAFADHVAIYRLGLSRNVEIEQALAELEKELSMAEAERLRLESERKALVDAWAELERERAALAEERRQLEREWQGLYDAREVEENIARLVTLYEQMRPEQLAEVLAGLEDALVIQMLFQMDERRAAALLGALPADRAARLSRMVAGEGR